VFKEMNLKVSDEQFELLQQLYGFLGIPDGTENEKFSKLLSYLGERSCMIEKGWLELQKSKRN